MHKFESNDFTFEEVTSTQQEVKIEAPQTTLAETDIVMEGMTLHKCPSCEKQTLKLENGCNTCMDKECGYGKCDV